MEDIECNDLKVQADAIYNDIFIEKYLEKPKHIEVQILGDKYGNIDWRSSGFRRYRADRGSGHYPGTAGFAPGSAHKDTL